MPRGKIIQYNPNDGLGTIVADGTQHSFAIQQWRGTAAPQLNQMVDISLENDALTSVTPVPDNVILAERASELKASLGNLGSSLGSTLSSTLNAAGGSAEGDKAAAIGKGFLERIGRNALIGYAIFFIATVFLSFVNIKLPFGGDRSFTLYEGAGLAGGGYRLIFYLAILSVIVPVFWRDRRGWLAYLLPVLTIVIAIFVAKSKTTGAFGGSESAGLGALLGDGAMDEIRREVSKMYSYGLGFYASIVSSVYIGFLGFKKFMARS